MNGSGRARPEWGVVSWVPIERSSSHPAKTQVELVIVVRADGTAVEFKLVATRFSGAQPALPFDTGETGVADAAVRQIGELDRSAGVDESAHAIGRNFPRGGLGDRRGVDDRHGAGRHGLGRRGEGRGADRRLRRSRLELIQPVQDRVELLFDAVELAWVVIARGPGRRRKQRCRRQAQRGKSGTSGGCYRWIAGGTVPNRSRSGAGAIATPSRDRPGSIFGNAVDTAGAGGASRAP